MTVAAEVLRTLRTPPICLTDAELVSMQGKCHKARYLALLGDVVWVPDRLDITSYLVTANGAVQEWERES